jgi:hypothetical protein
MNDARDIDTLTQIPYNIQKINEEDSWKKISEKEIKKEIGTVANR